MLLCFVPGLAVNLTTYADDAPLRTPLGQKVLLISALAMLMLPALGLVALLMGPGWRRWPGVVTVLLLLPAVGGCAVLFIATNKDFIFGDDWVRSESSPDGHQQVHLYSGWGNCKAVITQGFELSKAPQVSRSIYCRNVSPDGGAAQVQWLEDGGVELHGEASKPLFFGPH